MSKTTQLWGEVKTSLPVIELEIYNCSIHKPCRLCLGMACANTSWSEENFSCSICLDVFSSPVSTPCGHNFCRTNWVEDPGNLKHKQPYEHYKLYISMSGHSLNLGHISKNLCRLTRFIFFIQFNKILKEWKMPDRNVEDKISQCVCYFFEIQVLQIFD